MLTSVDGHKGLGLSVMLELLGVPLNGTAFGKEIPDLAAGGGCGNNSGYFILALDIEGSLLSRRSWQISSAWSRKRRSWAIPTERPVGTERAGRRAERVLDGLSLSLGLLDKLDLLARQLCISRSEMSPDCFRVSANLYETERCSLKTGLLVHRFNK